MGVSVASPEGTSESSPVALPEGYLVALLPELDSAPDSSDDQ